MNATPSRTPKGKPRKDNSWPRKVQPGRAVVTVYRRKTPVGNFAFMVANYAEGKRRWDCYSSEVEAIEAAETLAKRIDARDYVAASMTNDQAIEYANAVARLKPFGITVDAATSAVAECLKVVPGLANLHAAVQFYAARHKTITPKRVAEVVAELIAVKQQRGASARYLKDLHYRLDRFAEAFSMEIGNVTTAQIQEWLDSQKNLAPQSYRNFQTVLHLLFQFAVARSYAADNPVEAIDRVKVRGRDVAIFTPDEIRRLLNAADPEFLPCIAIGAFAGLRTAEIQRLEWRDIDLPGKTITVQAGKAKTASRRIVPLHPNLAEWLAPSAGREGRLWKHSSEFPFHRRQRLTAAATAIEADPEKNIKAQAPVKWRSNALRHSYASYRFAQTVDAGRVAGELGNSATIVHRHYRELVKPAQAEAWFNVRPEAPGNILALPVNVQSGAPGQSGQG
ncbi:MAG: tyrosine-type recombinase/integrase [Verrucomicrobiia bacterium]